ncbi:PREDICTED: LEM protein 2 [Nicrophorus vespilloides]|uniref:LEM protein 2 n=1 Tax=Nicrophorus vespilloides TaxID=110193 RepID=A0ABM1N3K0_NICVS|nr:PREDICTED: LEM protein 2 [Nicrophorus vespilloides]XP_017781400.1 PREDICTED: LEM protein 2 [Nicrophorus vespilloides]
MANVDEFTDSELRTKLIEYGFPVMPITGTTRKVMVKKLKLLMENKGKTNDRRSLAQFSSEEESDNDVKVIKKDKNRRATMAIVPPMQPPTIKNVKKILRSNDDEAPASKSTVFEERKTRSSKIEMSTTSKDNDTNSDSESEIVDTDYKKPVSRNVYIRKESPIKTSTYKYSSNSISSPVSDTLASRKYLSNRVSSYDASTSPKVDTSEKLNQIRSRLSLSNSVYDTSAYNPMESNDGTETPFLSNFTKRLSQLSSNKDDFNFKSDVIKESDANGSIPYNRSYLARNKPREYSREYHSTSEQSGSTKGGNYISFILVGAVMLFFLALTIVYWGMHSGGSNNTSAGLDLPLCKQLDENSRARENCVIEDDVQAAVDFYRVLQPKLTTRAISTICGDTELQPYMSEEEIITFIKDNYQSLDEFTITQDLSNFVILLFKNSFWGVTVLQKDGPEGSLLPIDSLDVVLRNKRNDFETYYAILNPSLPFQCNFYLILMTLLKTSSAIFGVAAVLWLCKKSYKYFKNYQKKKQEEIVLMVEKIIDILQSRASEEADNFLVINHIRDMILPIDNRKKMEKTWKKAVNFINENESRVRTEVQVVKGEPYEVWRWLGILNTSPARSKSWQGQAFETQEGSVNSLPCSPTPCLKIRGMVDDGDRNLHMIREAVLVKCAEQCKVLHCSVDSIAKCVYLKCAEQADAAIAYRNLHGWWFASELVTVKYIRLERYMQRFPDSPESGPPFLTAQPPSNMV